MIFILLIKLSLIIEQFLEGSNAAVGLDIFSLDIGLALVALLLHPKALAKMGTLVGEEFL